ncbi:cupin domain-containing protein [Halocatena pleomorpha]|uniref:Cupin domain-containing protein n=1 Tax=Halocatena pleomorpha TaxID=1785090 RepID=A0A3P3R452_9EURY|nr:cupin domain-containing protein [Halocatena pleomorpha]RRJ28252.1 cupin domain-containing protein [Halocatena pleomorpha]
MEHVHIESVEDWMGPASVKRPLGRALGTTSLAINYYELAPGESFAFGYHRHTEQEEVFYIQSGRVTFETEAGDVTVESGETIRFAPGEFQQGTNHGEARVTAIALGGPAEPGDTEIRRDCPDCGERTPQRIEPVDDALRTLCEHCDGETGRFT